MEFMSQYDACIVYVKGEDNTVTDTLSRKPKNTSVNIMVDAERRAKNTYTFCADDFDNNKITSVLPENCNACWNAAEYLSSMAAVPTDDLDSVSGVLSITADKQFLDDIIATFIINDNLQMFVYTTQSDIM
jgi:hypothetical protein